MYLTKTAKFMRKIRSFVRREGRLTKGQEKAPGRALAGHGHRFRTMPLDMVALFGREAPVVLEIGFRHGRLLVEMAKNAPGEELHRH